MISGEEEEPRGTHSSLGIHFQWPKYHLLYSSSANNATMGTKPLTHGRVFWFKLQHTIRWSCFFSGNLWLIQGSRIQVTYHHREVELMGIINDSPDMGEGMSSCLTFGRYQASHVCACASKLCSRSIPMNDVEGRTHTSYPSPLPQSWRPNVAGSADKWMAGEKFCVSKSWGHFWGLSKAPGFRAHPGDPRSSFACLVSTPILNASSEIRTRLAKSGVMSLTQGRNDKSLWGRVSGP